MKLHYFYILNVIFLFSLIGCAPQKLQFNCVLLDGDTNFDTLKWEIYPAKTGRIAIYSSKTPDNFEHISPLLYVDASDLVAFVPKSDNDRRYYRVVFDAYTEAKVASRAIKINGVNDFRDLGGYFATETEEIRWGKIYRSSKLSCIKPDGIDKLNCLKIKTLFDLRSESEKKNSTHHPQFKKVICMPMPPSYNDTILEKLMKAQYKKSDAFLHMQDLYSHYASNYDQQLQLLFDQLLNETNYPILIESGPGYHRSGFVSALIMAALNISEDDIYDNYLYQNRAAEVSDNNTIGEKLGTDEQEALTSMLSVQKSYLAYCFDKIRKENGSMEQYFTKKLKLTPEKREKLQQILLTH